MRTLCADSACYWLHRGFTLIEMMVVVLLIGLTLGLGLTLDFAGSPQNQEQQVQLFADTLELAIQQAVLDGAIGGLDFFAVAGSGVPQFGYRWLRLHDSGWQAHEANPAGPEFADVLFAAGLTPELQVGGQSLLPEDLVDLDNADARATFAPEIWLLPTREMGPFHLLLSSEGNEAFVTVDMLGRVRVNENAPVLR